MVDNQHGFDFEKEFVSRWDSLGKTAWLYRLLDSKSLYGRNKKLVLTGTQPADFLCGYSSWLGLVECKSTKDPKGFPIALVKKPQFIAATLSIAARTPYMFAIQNEPSQEWFLVPAGVILNAKGTVKWADLNPYLWTEPRLCGLLIT